MDSENDKNNEENAGLLEKKKRTLSNMSEASQEEDENHAGYTWLVICVVGMISSLTLYGISLEYATSNGHTLHELSFLFITCFIYSVVSYMARWLRGEPESKIPKYKMLILSITSVCSTFTSVRSLRYVIYPVQVLAKSCKPVPVLIFGLVLGKRYPLRKFVNITIITLGVALFMGGGKSHNSSSSHQGENMALIGGIFLFLSLCFDGITGAYEEKLMSKYKVEPFDLMFNIQVGKTMISFLLLTITNQLHHLATMVSDMGYVLLLLGCTGALGQVFVFITISKFGALNCSVIGLARKILSLCLSFLIYSHSINGVQMVGLVLSVSAMVLNFRDKKKGKKPKEITSGSGSVSGSGSGGDEEELVTSHSSNSDDHLSTPTHLSQNGVSSLEMAPTHTTNTSSSSNSSKPISHPDSFPEQSYIQQDQFLSPFSPDYTPPMKVTEDGKLIKIDQAIHQI